MTRSQFFITATTVTVLMVGSITWRSFGSNPAIENRFRANSGAVLKVWVDGQEVTPASFGKATPPTTYEWTPELALEGVDPPNIGPGLADY